MRIANIICNNLSCHVQTGFELLEFHAAFFVTNFVSKEFLVFSNIIKFVVFMIVIDGYYAFLTR